MVFLREKMKPFRQATLATFPFGDGLITASGKFSKRGNAKFPHPSQLSLCHLLHQGEGKPFRQTCGLPPSLSGTAQETASGKA